MVTERGVFAAPIVIGAGGHRCPVAQAFGEVSGDEEVVIAQESETRLSPDRLASLRASWEAPELYVEPDLKGYGWYFPKGDVLNVGVGCVAGPGVDLPRRRDALVEALHALGSSAARSPHRAVSRPRLRRAAAGAAPPRG